MVRGCFDLHPFYHIVSQFADDTSLFIKATEINLRNCFKALKHFELASGLMVNVKKTEAMYLYKDAEPLCPDIKIEWVKNHTRLLGISVCKDVDKMLQINYDGILNKIHNKLTMWRKRDLSIIGKVNILKSMGVSQLVYLFNMLPQPGDQYMKSLENELYKFVWNEGPDRIKRDTLIGPNELGGLNMINIYLFKQAINLGWMKRLINSNDLWKTGITFRCKLKCNNTNLHYLLQCNIHIKDLDKILNLENNRTWAEIWNCWCKYNYKKHSELNLEAQVLHQTVWFNSNIKIQNAPVFYRNCYDNGIWYIKDLVKDNRWKT